MRNSWSLAILTLGGLTLSLPLAHAQTEDTNTASDTDTSVSETIEPAESQGKEDKKANAENSPQKKSSSHTIWIENQPHTIEIPQSALQYHQTETYQLAIGQLQIPLDLPTLDLTEPTTAWLPIQSNSSETIALGPLVEHFAQQPLPGTQAQPNAVTITQDTDADTGEAILAFSGQPEGVFVPDYATLASLIGQSRGTVPVRAPGRIRYPEVTLPDSLRQRGITDVIAIGQSTFHGSSENRVKNIIAASNKFQGALIPQGSEFSFNDILEDVDPEDGFVPEKVILHGKLEDRLGGGTCQVSTTVYRTALAAGLPITERNPHSYIVDYYGEPGRDAAIYLGSIDLKFVNDTPADILLQYALDGQEITFVMYGTPDGRRVDMTEPVITYTRDIPDTQFTYDYNLSPGQRVRESEGKIGHDTEMDRTIRYANGEVKTETFVSKYRAKAPEIRIGPKRTTPTKTVTATSTATVAVAPAAPPAPAATPSAPVTPPKAYPVY